MTRASIADRTSATSDRSAHGGPTSWPAARALAHRLAEPLPAEDVALAAAAGRTLAAPVVAAVTLPACDNAAMDGYAVRGRGPWRVTGRVLAGQLVTAALANGQAVEIATGAPVPRGTDRVVRSEVCQRDGELLHAADEPRTHIRRAGEFVRAGQAVLAAGDVLRPAALGLAASVGTDTVTVRRRARVRVLVTGDEVVGAGVPPPGLVRDAIGPTLAALLPAWGADTEGVRWVPDAPADLAHAVADSVSTVDVTLVCGASSIGPADHLHRVVRDLDARLHVDGVACRPGHPQVLAQVGASWIVGLPGNPFAALVAAGTLAQPLLAGLAGQALPDLPRVALAGQVAGDEHHTRLLPVRWQAGRLGVIDGARPGHLGAAAHADALAIIPPGPRPVATVEVLLLPSG